MGLMCILLQQTGKSNVMKLMKRIGYAKAIF